MNLTWTQVGDILKCIRLTQWHGETSETHHYLMKRPSYCFSEEVYIAWLRKEFNLAFYSCLPSAWIMGAADDTSYCVVDLEDTVEKRIFITEQLYHHLHEAWGQHEKGLLFSLAVKNAWERSRSNSLGRSAENRFFMYLWTSTPSKLIPYVARRLIDNLPATFTRTFSHVLLEDANECSNLLKPCKNVTTKRTFSYSDAEQFELQGYRVISGLLKICRLLLSLPLLDFTELVEKERARRSPIEPRLFHKLPTRHRLVYIETASKLPSDSPEFLLWRYYYRYCLLQDHISGTTDLYARNKYRCLMTVEQ